MTTRRLDVFVCVRAGVRACARVQRLIDCLIDVFCMFLRDDFVNPMLLTT